MRINHYARVSKTIYNYHASFIHHTSFTAIQIVELMTMLDKSKVLWCLSKTGIWLTLTYPLFILLVLPRIVAFILDYQNWKLIHFTRLHRYKLRFQILASYCSNLEFALDPQLEINLEFKKEIGITTKSI